MAMRGACSLVELDAREHAVLGLLDRWPWHLGGVIIGGYAVMAYGPPRYSDDLDVVIPKTAADETRGWLTAQGFELEKRTTPNPENFDGQVERYLQPPVTIDLLTNAVRDRHAKVDVPEAWISKRPLRAPLVTLSGRTTSNVPIARPEALWALKLQAGRPRDISDLFAIAETPFDSTEVTDLFVGLATESLVSKLRAVQTSLGSEKTFVDSLSRRGLGSPLRAVNVRAWASFRAKASRIIEVVERQAGVAWRS
jgi:Nucleotidyl transferase AbiEii toxin, Type IV TA system